MLSDDTSDGASYLSALKRSGAPQAAGTAPAPTVASDPVPQNRSHAEKRRSPRYKCQGSAQLREINSGEAIWATFTDISLHGCYVEATSTYRIGSMLALKIDVNGFRVETRGEVRVAYPNLGMGIFFTTMSDEDRERLRELLRSLSRPPAILGSGGPSRISTVARSDASDAITNPNISNPRAALHALVEFFEDRQMLSREEFRRILRKSQGAAT
jgi:hypothetical protein